MRIVILAALLCLAGSSGIRALQIGAPSGSAGRAALPPEREAAIGRSIAATMAGRYRLLADPDLARYVNLVGAAVAAESVRRAELAFRFGVLDIDEVNSFAAPAGYILITRGALALMESEAELAGVLAHEVGHVDGNHVLEELRSVGVLQAVREEAQLSGELLDRVTGLGASLLFTGLSREDELEADSLGLTYAVAAGSRPDGLLRFIDRLGKATDDEGAAARLRALRLTHPAAPDRRAALERQLAALGLEPGTGEDPIDRFRANVRRDH